MGDLPIPSGTPGFVSGGVALGGVARAEHAKTDARTRRAAALRRMQQAQRALERAQVTHAQTEKIIAREQARRSAPQLAEHSRVADLVPRGDLRRLTLFDADFCWVDDQSAVLEAILHAALRLSGADMGNIQLLDPTVQALRIRVQQGFDTDFLAFFGLVDDQHSACGAALAEGRIVHVRDVARSAIFSDPARDTILNASVRSVASVPLLAPQGEPIGVLSVHYRRPQDPEPLRRNALTTVATVGARRVQRCASPESNR